MLDHVLAIVNNLFGSFPVPQMGHFRVTMVGGRELHIKMLVSGTADAAFAIDSSTGIIRAWNDHAEKLFGVASTDAVGRPCHEVLRGTDEAGVVCSKHCSVMVATRANQPIANFDVEIDTKSGRQWCNISILIASELGADPGYTIHIVRPRQIRKRFEQLARQFGLQETRSSRQNTLVSGEAAGVGLTRREKQILKMLGDGINTNMIANDLCISVTTVNNHVKHILKKLGAHTRLEAVRDAERAKLI